MKSALDIIAGKHSHTRKPVMYQSSVDTVAWAVHNLSDLSRDKMKITKRQRLKLRRARRRLGTMLDLP